jgi:2-dehydro-3-deoxyphosphogluconate aldolase / (4S)-4-hydroxy-2-oxoglutarate aldolase
MTPAEARRESTALGMVPLFYDPDAARARATVLALARGGATLVEFTLRGPGAEAVLAELVSHAPEGVTIGAGSVSTPQQLEAALGAGAAFIVGPNADRAIAERCLASEVAYVPGCLTPSEMVAARSWGCPLVKVFPIAALGGPAYVRAIRGPLPDLAMMVTGGVTVGNALDYLAAGAACVGLGSDLVRLDWVAEDDGRRLAEATDALLSAIRRQRGEAG